MNMPLNDWIAALPSEVADDSRPVCVVSELERLLGQLGSKPVPASRVGRLWVLGSVHARIAAGYLAYWLRAGFVPAGDRERRLNETHLRAALKLLGAMSYLRGSVMKIGQMLANFPRLMPDEFVQVLSALHFEAPPMHYSLLREFLRDELGADPEETFEEFETTAFAAASLGQVHRARLPGGPRVVVKVQYPGIASTIDSDFRNMLALLMPMRLSSDWDVIRAQFDDAREVLTGETDYRREASFLERAAAVFSAADRIVVPRVFPKYSTRRVLTMEDLGGVHLDQYLARCPSQSERDRYGELIMRSSFRLAHKARFWYADANPGNYLFRPDGSLGLLDFGCCREYNNHEWDVYRQLVRAYRDDPSSLRPAVLQAAALNPADADETYVQFLEEYSRWFSQYMIVDQVFDFGDEAFMRRGVELMAESFRQRYFRSLPMNTWIIRQLLGLRGIAYRLSARINMRRIGEEERWGIY